MFILIVKIVNDGHNAEISNDDSMKIFHADKAAVPFAILEP